MNKQRAFTEHPTSAAWLKRGQAPSPNWRSRPRKRVLIPVAERARVLFERELHVALRKAGFNAVAHVEAAGSASIARDREAQKATATDDGSRHA